MAPALAAAGALGLMLTSGCSIYREATTTTIPATSNWRTVATDADRQRLRNWRKAWDEALPKAQAADAGAIAAEPLLFDPDRAQEKADLPVGDYRCRTFKLGSKSDIVRDYTAYPWLQCRVTQQGEVRELARLEGEQRPIGLVFPDGDDRSVFLGTLMLGDETTPLRYGLDASRNMIGYIDRIDARRWRLVLPYPEFESTLDVIELVPAT
ncbi:MAG: DUF4893 domain-containing protein [Sphingomonas sp.]